MNMSWPVMGTEILIHAAQQTSCHLVLIRLLLINLVFSAPFGLIEELFELLLFKISLLLLLLLFKSFWAFWMFLFLYFYIFIEEDIGRHIDDNDLFRRFFPLFPFFPLFHFLAFFKVFAIFPSFCELFLAFYFYFSGFFWLFKNF